MTTIQDLVAQMYQVLIGQIVLAVLAGWGLINILGQVSKMFKWLACLHYRKPKIIFLEYYWTKGEDISTLYEYHIPVINSELKGWSRRNCNRDDAIACQIKVRFTIADKPFGEANWWSDRLIVGKTLKPDLNSEMFPLVILKREQDGKPIISLAGTSKATSGCVPPDEIPFDTDIIADVLVISEGKRIAQSKWIIHITSNIIDPISIKRKM